MQAPAPSACPAAFVHATDAVDTFALPGITLGFWPGLGMTVSAVGNFCITATNETVTPTGGITCSALGDAVNRHLLRPRLTSARSSRRLSTLGSTVVNAQIFQSNSRDPAYILSDLCHSVPCKYWALAIVAA